MDANYIEIIKEEREKTAQKLAALDYVLDILNSEAIYKPKEEKKQTRKKREEHDPADPAFATVQSFIPPQVKGGICDV